MVQIIPASDLELGDVKQQFGLEFVQEADFFSEWQQPLPEIDSAERRWLDQIKADFLNFINYPPHEEIVKMFALAPLLMMAGLSRPPFVPRAEYQVEIAFEDEDKMIRGKIDLLVLHEKFWAIVVEAKRQRLNVLEGLPQALTYMMKSANGTQPTYGFITNGTEFLFVKLVPQETPQYGLSRLFTLINPGNDLYSVLGILKELRDRILASC